MDYEKEYKRKALEPIVSYIESVMASYSKEELEARIKNALPKKESEDEMVRKYIITRVMEENMSHYLRELIIAYLEKQKEPQHAIRVTKGFGDPDGPQFELVDLQKEQKPAEKISVSEELYEHIRNACACIDDAMSSDTMCDMTNYLEMANSSAQKAFDMVDKSVVKQPAEWSKEEEKDIQEASDYLRDYANNYVQGGNSKLYIQSLADRIESLNPQSHWKPSEEQIKAIDLAIRFVTDDFDEHPTLSETLRGLYNELKKLL